MEGSVRRSQPDTGTGHHNLVTVPGHKLQHQVSVRFRADTWTSVGCDVTSATCPDTCLNGVVISVSVRPSVTGADDSPDQQNVEMVISTPGIR